jgi:hypothetical protein
LIGVLIVRSAQAMMRIRAFLITAGYAFTRIMQFLYLLAVDNRHFSGEHCASEIDTTSESSRQGRQAAA